MFTLASVLFFAATAFIFLPLDLRDRFVSHKLFKTVFFSCLAVFIILDIFILKTVSTIGIIIGIICFILSYLFFAGAVMAGTIGAADVKIFSGLVLFFPVYPEDLILPGYSLIPAMDIFCNFMIFAYPLTLLFRRLQPGRPAPGLAGLVLAVLISCFFGNLLLSFFIYLIDLFPSVAVYSNMLF